MKILKLTEGSFPINLSYELESIDVPRIGSLIGNLEVKLRILRISNNLLKCDGSIKGDFTDICQNSLKDTILNIFSEIDVTLKDLNEIHSDSSDVACVLRVVEVHPPQPLNQEGKGRLS